MIEPGSFRDPAARVFYDGQRVLRGLSADAAEADRSARASGIMKALTDRGLFVENWVAEDAVAPPGVPNAAIIESRRIPVISYPSEWSFGMLKKSALLTLEANLTALDGGYILKDASAFNVAFDGVEPRILDVSSIEPFGEKGIWTAYGQFCDHFLAPLLLDAYVGAPFQGLLAHKIEGLKITELSRMLRGRAGLHRGVLSHVRLRSMLERRTSRLDTAARSDIGRLTLPKAAVVSRIKKMKSLVARLESTAPSTWSGYEDALPYEPSEVTAKEDFVRSAAASVNDRSMALDVGANAGRFTRLLAAVFDHVVAIDNDQGAIDALYRTASDEGLANLTPMVVDITNPPQAFGWRGRERQAFFDRVRPTFATWLAVVHHLCLSVGVPLEEVVALVYEVSEESVVEFVSAEDPMARHISATRRSSLAPYTPDIFEHHASAGGTIVRSEQVSATRTMYHLKRL